MVKVGMISFAHMHAYSYALALTMLSDKVEFVGIADDNEVRGKNALDKFGAKRYYKDYNELLAQDVDAVIICSPNVAHKEMAVASAKAGKHILCEKPISITIADAQAMIEASEENNVQLMTAFPCRFTASSIQTKQMLEQEAIGEILAIKGTNHGRMPPGWFLEKEKSGGGAVMDHTVHVVDLWRWFFGKEIVEVYAEIDTLLHDVDIDDCGILTVEFENGMFASLDASWSRPKSFPTWGDVTMEIVGTEGVIDLDLFAQNMAVYSDRTMSTDWVFWGENMDLAMITDFVEAVETGSSVKVTGWDGLKAMEVALGAYKSASEGKPVKLPL